MWYDTLLVIGILLFFGLLIWARVQNQKIIDILREIRDFWRETFVKNG